MWGACVGVYQLLNWKMCCEILKFVHGDAFYKYLYKGIEV